MTGSSIQSLQDAPPQSPRISFLDFMAGLCVVASVASLLFTALAMRPGRPLTGSMPSDFVYWQPNGGYWMLAALAVVFAGIFVSVKMQHSRPRFVRVVLAVTVALDLCCCWFEVRSGVTVTTSEVVLRSGDFWTSDRHLPLSNLKGVRSDCAYRSSGKGGDYQPWLVLDFATARGDTLVPIGKPLNDEQFPRWLDATAVIAGLPTVQAAPHTVSESLDANCLRHFTEMLDPQRKQLFYSVLSVEPQ